MFTGIVSDIGTVIRIEGEGGAGEGGCGEEGGRLRRLRIACGYDVGGIEIGASIAHAGICLTVIAKGRADHAGSGGGGWYDVEAAAETLRLTQAGVWQVGTVLNLERALKLGDELGGHMVSGHVDGLAEILAREEITSDAADGGMTSRFTLRAPPPLHRFIAAKGSVTLDGTSLTVNSVEGELFSVLLIPHTLKVTTWHLRWAGERVHLEVDIMARYAARLAETA